MEIPVLLQQLRRDAGLTQSQVAARAGTSQATLHRLTHACGAMLEINVTAAPRTDLSGHRARQLRQSRCRIKSLARSIGANNVRVFGFVARGDDDEHSDIDLLVQPVDVAPLAALKPEAARAALAEAVPLREVTTSSYAHLTPSRPIDLWAGALGPCLTRSVERH